MVKFNIGLFNVEIHSRPTLIFLSNLPIQFGRVQYSSRVDVRMLVLSTLTLDVVQQSWIIISSLHFTLTSL